MTREPFRQDFAGLQQGDILVVEVDAEGKMSIIDNGKLLGIPFTDVHCGVYSAVSLGSENHSLTILRGSSSSRRQRRWEVSLRLRRQRLIPSDYSRASRNPWLDFASLF